MRENSAPAAGSARLQGRFHFVYILKIIRYGLILCLLPMARALLAFDLASLYAALRQDAAILAAMALAGLVFWRREGFALTGSALVLEYGVLLRRQRRIACARIAVLEQARPLLLRMLGATRVTVYLTHGRGMNRAVFYLPRSQAAALAQLVLPLAGDEAIFAPARAERLRLTVLSANLAATAALAAVGVRQTRRLLGQDAGRWLEQAALGQLAQLEKLLELVLPAGVAWLAAAGFALWGVSLFWSLLSTAGFKVCRSGGVILAQGGHVNHIQRRIRASALTACDLRLTPAGRFLRRQSVYLSAGSYRGGDIPVLVCRPGDEALLAALLPGFAPCAAAPEPLADRSPWLFVWKGGAGFLFCAALAGVSLWRLPQLTGLLALPLAACFLLVLAGLDAWVTEGAGQAPGGPPVFRFTRGFTRHTVYLLTPDAALCLRTSPFSQAAGRCEVRLRLPCRVRLRVRAVKAAGAQRLRLPAGD